MRANRGGRNGLLIRGGMMRSPITAQDSTLTLLDAKGKSFEEKSRSNELAGMNNGILCNDVLLTYEPAKGQSEPAQLISMGQRTVSIEIPFVLKDVPLP
jgi:hypothetical protein